MRAIYIRVMIEKRHLSYQTEIHVKMAYIFRFICKISTSSLFLAGLFLICLACSEEKAVYRDFYAPTRACVYVYATNDSTGREYWMMEPKEGGLHISVFDENFQLTQESQEVFYENGVKQERLILYDDGAARTAEIEDGFVFSFEPIDSLEVLLYRINWQMKPTSGGGMVGYRLLRNRRFLASERCHIQAPQLTDREEVLCIRLKIEERIIQEMDGSMELESSGEEWYGDGIGLLRRIRMVGGNFPLIHQLIDVMETEDFLAMLEQNRAME